LKIARRPTDTARPTIAYVYHALYCGSNAGGQESQRGGETDNVGSLGPIIERAKEQRSCESNGFSRKKMSRRDRASRRTGQLSLRLVSLLDPPRIAAPEVIRYRSDGARRCAENKMLLADEIPRECHQSSRDTFGNVHVQWAKRLCAPISLFDSIRLPKQLIDRASFLETDLARVRRKFGVGKFLRSLRNEPFLVVSASRRKLEFRSGIWNPKWDFIVRLARTRECKVRRRRARE